MKAHRTSVPVFKHAEFVEPGSEVQDIVVAPVLRARMAHLLLSLSGIASRFLRGKTPRLFHDRAEKAAYNLDRTRMKTAQTNHSRFF